MLSLALQLLEKSMNSYLNLDPDTITRLSQLQGKAIQLNIKDWRINFFILPKSHGLELHHKISEEPDTIITGNLNALIRLYLAKASNAALFENRIQIEGDLNTGETLRTILTEIDIDWEEHLSKVTGDIAAHKIGTTIKSIKASFQNTKNTLEQNLKEFLHYELRALPTNEEVHTFIDAVTELRHAVERAEARINRLQHQRNLHS